MFIFIKAYIDSLRVVTPRPVDIIPVVEVETTIQVACETPEPKLKTKSGFDFFTQTTARAKQQRRG